MEERKINGRVSLRTDGRALDRRDLIFLETRLPRILLKKEKGKECSLSPFLAVLTRDFAPRRRWMKRNFCPLLHAQDVPRANVHFCALQLVNGLDVPRYMCETEVMEDVNVAPAVATVMEYTTTSGNHTSKNANGNIITLTLKNNHLIVETEERAVRTSLWEISGVSLQRKQWLAPENPFPFLHVYPNETAKRRKTRRRSRNNRVRDWLVFGPGGSRFVIIELGRPW